MRIWTHRVAGIAVAGLGFVLSVLGAETQIAAGTGASRDEVYQAYGWPTGQSRSGAREILSYPQGQVTLENGRVVRVDFSSKLPWPAPRPRPAPASPVSAKKAVASAFLWTEDFEAAAREASRRGVPILALFMARDNAPESRRFHEQVATHPDFANALAADFVFLRLDASGSVPSMPGLREQNERMAARHAVTVYPALLVLSPAGDASAAIDLATPQWGEAFRARVIMAIRAERARYAAETATKAAIAAVAAAEAGGVVNFLAQKFGLSMAGSFAAGVAVVLTVALLVWLLRRTGTPKNLPQAAVAVRLTNAAGGVPTPSEITAWPKEKICAVTAAMAESEGYLAEVMPFGSGKDIVLKNRGDTNPRVVVFCAAGDTGRVAAKRLRELRGTLTADGALTGWYVSPKGFADDALAYAEEHQLHLIDASRMVERLRELPPLLLPRVLPGTAERAAA